MRLRVHGTPPATPTTTSLRAHRRRAAQRPGGVHRRLAALRRDRPHRPARPDAHRRAHPRPVRTRCAGWPPSCPTGRRCYPTHGFGSFCSATPTSGDVLHHRRSSARVNPALTQDEQTFVDRAARRPRRLPRLLRAHGPGQRRRPGRRPTCPPPAPADPAELRRPASPPASGSSTCATRTAFAAGHLPGTLNFGLGDQFATYLGWLVPWGAPLTLLGETARAGRRGPARAGPHRHRPPRRRRRPARPSSWPTAARCAATRSATSPASPQMAADRPVIVARRPPRRRVRRRRSRRRLNIPLHELPDRVDEVPAGEVWVHCGCGYRASIAASLLARAGRRPVLVDGGVWRPRHRRGRRRPARPARHRLTHCTFRTTREEDHPMCRATTCRTCGKTTWAGCGQHVDQVMRGVPAAQRCPGHDTDTPRPPRTAGAAVLPPVTPARLAGAAVQPRPPADGPPAPR